MKTIPIEKFGKDHWSTFGYLETVIEDSKKGSGTPDLRRMRCNERVTPGFNANGFGWKPEYGTRLAGFFDAEVPEIKASLQIADHDDWCCLDDAEEAGLIENIGTGVNRVYKFTDLGQKIANQLREHKRRGGHFYQFKPDLSGEQALVEKTASKTARLGILVQD